MCPKQQLVLNIMLWVTGDFGFLKQVILRQFCVGNYIPNVLDTMKVPYGDKLCSQNGVGGRSKKFLKMKFDRFLKILKGLVPCYKVLQMEMRANAMQLQSRCNWRIKVLCENKYQFVGICHTKKNHCSNQTFQLRGWITLSITAIAVIFPEILVTSEQSRLHTLPDKKFWSPASKK